jgi:hypothetical protein
MKFNEAIKPASSGWQGWLHLIPRAREGKRTRGNRRSKLELEHLEDRVALATQVTVLASGVGSLDAAFLAGQGQLLFSAPDAGTGTNFDTLSAGALASIVSTDNIIVQATQTITFNDLGGVLALKTGLGASATFSTDTMGGGTISFTNVADTLATAGGGITFSAGTDLTVANLNTNGGAVLLSAGTAAITPTGVALTIDGSINAPSSTVVLKSTGAVLSGTPSADISAAGLAISAATGIGSATNPLKTSVGTFAAVNSSGGVFVTNTGNLAVGTVGSLTGLTASGDINLASTAASGLANLTVNAGVTVGSTGGNVTLAAGGGLILNAGTIVRASTSANTVTLKVGLDNRGGNSVISGTVDGSSVVLTSGTGADAVTVDFAGGASLPHPLSVIGNSSDALTLSDAGSTGGMSYTISATSVTRVPPVIAVAIKYSGLKTLTVTGGDGGNTFNVGGTAAGTQTFLNAGGGTNSITVSDPNDGTLNGIHGVVNLDGQNGTNTLTVSDLLNPVGQTYTITGTAVQRTAGAVQINYTHVASLVVFGGYGGNIFNVTPSAGTSMRINGGSNAGHPPVVLPGDLFNFNATNLPVVTPYPAFTASGMAPVEHFNTTTLNISASAVNTFSSPDVVDRGTAFAGLTAQERFVQALYLDVLGRVGTKAELDGWVARLVAPGGTQKSVAAEIEASFEARERLVRTWYQTYLGRSAQNYEELGWANLLLTDVEEHVLSEILGAGEFFTHAQTLIASGTPEERFVKALFQLLLGRQGTSNEVAVGVDVLARSSQQNLAFQFLIGQFPPAFKGPLLEFRQDDFNGYYNTLLRREADVNGLNAWVFSNLDIRSVRIDFESSPEFFANG